MPFDLDTFIAECLDATKETDARGAVQAIVERAISAPSAIEAVLTRRLGDDLGILHYSPELTIEHVVFPPRHRTGIHNHHIWAVIGTWAGHEDNTFYRRADDGIVNVGTTRCRIGKTIMLDSQAIHEVTAPDDSGSAALHVYGGALFDQPRSGWIGEPPVEAPHDDAAYLERYLDELRSADLLQTETR